MAEKIKDAAKKREQYGKLRGRLLLTRSNFEGHWRDIGNHILPTRTRFWTTDKDQDRRNVKIIDPTGSLACRTFQSGLHSGITSPSRPWFRLTTPDPDLAEFAPVKQWLHTVTQRMYTVFAGSNLYNTLSTLYGDIGAFGTGAMYIDEDDKDVARGYSFPIGSFALGLDKRQQVKTFMREYPMTVRQVVDEFGRPDGSNTIDWTNISSVVKNHWEKGNYENNIAVCWIVMPNQDHDPDKAASRYLPFVSIRFEKGTESDKLLEEKGYHEFPIMAPRWEVTGEDTYATNCPGMQSLPDIRSLQVMQRRKAQFVEKGLNPAVQAPTSLRNQKISMIPGDVTFVDQLQQQNAAIRPINEVNAAFVRWITEDIKEVQLRVSRAFFEDLFIMLANGDNPRMTAREVAERHEEKLLMLGPPLERMNDELYGPMIDRVYNIMDRRGEIPPAPKELSGMKLKVEYISLIASSQKLVGAGLLQRFIQDVVPLSEQSPVIHHKIDFMQVVDDFGEMYGVNPKIVIPDDQAQQSLKAEQEMVARKQQMELAEQGSKTAKNLSGSNLQDDSALKRLMEQQGVPS